MSHNKLGLSLLCTALVSSMLSGCQKTPEVSPTSSPVKLTVWTYYNGDQLAAFNSLVDEFNKTVGQEQNISIESYSQGSVTDLETNLMAAAEQKVGAADLPNIFSGYVDTAYSLDEMGLLTDLSGYLSDEERDAYIDGYLNEGNFSGDGTLKLFPIVKSTELLFLNETDWEPFAEATGATYDNLSTIEGLISTAELYYNWTDAQTEEPDDGRALFGRDAMANYLLVGAKQLGTTIFDVKDGKMTLNFDKQTVRTLWDSYYVPFIKGYFAASGRFRSDDVKTGNLIAYQGSSSSASFFPTQVSTSDSESHEIQLKVLPAPKFKDGADVAVQQGAGMAVTKGSDEQTNAAVTFLKWITQPEHNIKFSVDSGYMPVTKYASNIDHIEESGLSVSDSIRDILTVSFDTVTSNELYTTGAFAGYKDARQVLEYALSDQAANDRTIVEDRIAQGMSAKDAEAEFLSDDAFESWYQTTLNRLQAFQD